MYEQQRAFAAFQQLDTLNALPRHHLYDDYSCFCCAREPLAPQPHLHERTVKFVKDTSLSFAIERLPSSTRALIKGLLPKCLSEMFPMLGSWLTNSMNTT